MTMISEAMRLPLTFGLSGALHVAALWGLVFPPPPVTSPSRPPMQVLLAPPSMVTGASLADLHRVHRAPVLNRDDSSKNRRAAGVKTPSPLTRALISPRAAFSAVPLADPRLKINTIPVERAPLSLATATNPTLSEVSLTEAKTSETSAVANNAAVDRNAADDGAVQSTVGGNQGSLSSELDGTLNSPFKVPKALYSPLRKYPEEARWEGRTGQGSLGFRLKSDGSVDPEIKILRSSGHADLDATAVESLRRWRFAPPPGAAPSSWYHYPFRFGIS